MKVYRQIVSLFARLIVIILVFIQSASLYLPARSALAAPSDLFFSEYVEGTGNNIALEIYNGTGAAINLGANGYKVQIFFNGSTRTGKTLNLSGTVAPGDVFILAHSNADPAILAEADQTIRSGLFTGDDAVVLRKGSTDLDVIGQVGFDPGAEWGSGLASTQDNTLRRKGSIAAGDPLGNDPFDPAIEWDGFATNTFDGLGEHGVSSGGEVIANCGGPLSTEEGIPVSTTVSASDSDGIVVDIAITNVTPTPNPGSVSLGGLVPAPSVGATATADVMVDGDVPAGNYSILITATNDDPSPQTGSCTLFVNVSSGSLKISDVQGLAQESPMEGDSVEVSGIVTAKSSNGFYMQDAQGDGNPATSDGIFVYTGSSPSVAIGNLVTVSGVVSEFQPGGSSTHNLKTTELTSPDVTILSSGNPLPAPIVIGVGGRVPPGEVIDDDNNTAYNPGTDGLDFYESLEGMRVQVNGAVAVGPINAFNEVPIIGDDGALAGVRTSRGGIVIQPGDFNPERIILDDLLVPLPAVNVGDHFNGPVVGVMDYDFGNFKLLVTESLVAVPAGLGAETTVPASPGQLSVATFNVLNLDPNDGSGKFNALASQIVDNLGSPDLIGLQEIQDNNGATNNRIVDASQTYGMLIAAIQAEGGPVYAYRDIAPVSNKDGGEPGGNIRVGFLFRTDRGLSFVDRPGGTATNSTAAINGAGGLQLSYSPGRIDPANAAFLDSRKPLAGEFLFNGVKFFAIINHFNSKFGDSPLFGDLQPPVLGSAAQRIQQAQIVNNFVDSLLAIDPQAKIIVLGDLNDFQFSTPLDTLSGTVLQDLVETLPLSEQYTYIYEGNSQVLDHILVSNALYGLSWSFDIVHANAEYVATARPTDHDPAVLKVCLAPGCP